MSASHRTGAGAGAGLLGTEDASGDVPSSKGFDCAPGRSASAVTGVCGYAHGVSRPPRLQSCHRISAHTCRHTESFCFFDASRVRSAGGAGHAGWHRHCDCCARARAVRDHQGAPPHSGPLPSSVRAACSTAQPVSMHTAHTRRGAGDADRLVMRGSMCRCSKSGPRWEQSGTSTSCAQVQCPPTHLRTSNKSFRLSHLRRCVFASCAGFFSQVALTRVVANFLVQFGIAADPAVQRQWNAKGNIQVLKSWGCWATALCWTGSRDIEPPTHSPLPVLRTTP